MATLIPANGGHPGASAQSSNVEATYEDMFKEITRKLYGEETGNGLHTLGTPVAQVATSGPTAVPEGEQRSFTNLQLDRSAAPSIEYESSGAANGATTSNNVATSQANVIQQQQQQQQQQTESGNSVVVTATSGVGGATVVPAPSVAVGGFKSEDHLSTAFGLAALMQNGFAAGQAGLLKAGGDQQQRWAQDGGAGVIAAAAADQQPQLVQWTTGGKLQSYAHVSQQQQQQLQQQQQQQQPQQQHHHQSTPKSKKHRQEHAAELIYASPSTSANAVVQNLTQSTPTSAPSNSSGGSSSSGGSRKKSSAQAQAAAAANGVHIQKRYACTHCPYSTDRRDLYTRHENIHKDEKPFQCYACLKQFNRADHVKKHFLRMHRELQYDINKTRRHVSAGSSSGSGSSGNSHHSGGRGNVTINATGVNIDNAFLEAQRHPTSTSMSIVETIEAVASAGEMPLAQLKQEKMDDGSVLPLHVGVVMNNAQQPVASSSSGSSSGGGGNGGGNSSGSGLLKPKREKRFTCCYCPWSGADKWGLKRHLNTHTKPFVCLLCDYKAARSERLATHVLKVHNKRACSKCSYLADTQEEYQVHMSDVHPHDNRPSRSGNSTNNNGNSNNNGSGGGNNNNAGGNNVSHSQNLNVLRTIGNTLVANNQLNTYAGNAFGSSSGNVGNGNGGNAVTIYTTSNEGGGSGSGNITGGGGGGPLQEIIVNPTSMVGWRLSANGSLIPPHDLLTGGLPNASTQKRGSERLFQYLEAEGSDPEDYARLLKMDAISRNTASVAQDFHKAGGVHELKIPANHQLLFNNKLPSQWTTREAAALLYSLSNMGTHSGSNSNSNSSSSSSQRQKFGIRARQHSTGEDDENTPSSASSSSFSGDEYNMLSTSPVKVSRHVKLEKHEVADGKEEKVPVQVQAKAMMATAFLEAASYEQTAIELLSSKRKIKIENDEDQENQEQSQPQLQQRLQLIKSSPAYKLNSNNNNSNTNHKDKSSHRNAVHHNHRQDDKENNTKSAAIAAAAAAVTAAAAAAAAGGGGGGAGAIAPSTTNQTPFLTQMEYQNLNRIGTQFHNYVKDIINKYYAAETPLMLAATAAALPTATTTGQQRQLDLENMSPSKRRRLLSETEEYIEYLRNKEDITLTITPRAPTVKSSPPQPPAASLLKRQLDLAVPRKSPKKAAPAHSHSQTHSQAAMSNGHSVNAARKSISQLATLLPLLADAASKQEYLAAPLDFSKKSDGENGRSSRKQAQPKKIRLTPEAVVGLLRDKYLNRMVRQKLGCLKCNQVRRNSTISFNYHTIGSLALHRYWRHGQTRASRQRVQAECCSGVAGTVQLQPNK
ncbi:protein charlatan isoform X2 [Drosophila guanche]|uniref:protein charlatan isoform X2 n=1 Tax=Drosophila guanche TaxID=7266 RepID=UPI001471C7A2|nr:protein charlatan isoform X2 [Drosophila guanche]